MRILALDTAMAQTAVALWEGAPGTAGRVLAAQDQPMDRGQAEALLPMVAAVMADAGVAFDSLDRIAATRGPGAFTGLRIGLAAARGLGLAAGVPVVGVLTTAVLAARAREDVGPARGLLVALDTKRGDFYAAFAAPGAPVGAAQVVGTDGLANLVHGCDAALDVIGDGADAAVAALRVAGVAATVADAPALPDAAWIARLAADLDVADPDARPDPLYLRPPAVNLPGIGRVG